jgi:hypothetical protein
VNVDLSDAMAGPAILPRPAGHMPGPTFSTAP